MNRDIPFVDLRSTDLLGMTMSDTALTKLLGSIVLAAMQHDCDVSVFKDGNTRERVIRIYGIGASRVCDEAMPKDQRALPKELSS